MDLVPSRHVAHRKTWRCASSRCREAIVSAQTNSTSTAVHMYRARTPNVDVLAPHKRLRYGGYGRKGAAAALFTRGYCSPVATVAAAVLFIPLGFSNPHVHVYSGH
jgi:hypothetical protein